jgi:hypothetical protein
MMYDVSIPALGSFLIDILSSIIGGPMLAVSLG